MVIRMLDEIKKNPLYKNHSNMDMKARDAINKKRKDSKDSKSSILPGQLVLFKYLSPLHKDELPYYDRSPLTIFFGMVSTKEGKRVLGFNLHYLPRNVRFMVMDRIFELFRPVYQKYFDSKMNEELVGFDYGFLLEELEKWDMRWCVRMYVPNLIGDVYCVEPKWWSTAAFTEGWFMKESRTRIMKYWKERMQGYNPVLDGGKKKKKRS